MLWVLMMWFLLINSNESYTYSPYVRLNIYKNHLLKKKKSNIKSNIKFCKVDSDCPKFCCEIYNNFNICCSDINRSVDPFKNNKKYQKQFVPVVIPIPINPYEY